MKKRYRITLLRTCGEWEKINAHVIGQGNLDWNKFWKKSISFLKEKYRECPECVTCAEGGKMPKVLNLTEEQYRLLEAIASQMQKPVASVIDELVISPILYEPAP